MTTSAISYDAPHPAVWSVFMNRKTRNSFPVYLLSDPVGLPTVQGLSNPTVEPSDIKPRLTLLDGNLRPISGHSLSDRIMARLAQSEAREVNPHLADDCRIAWLTVYNAAQGIADPWRYSFWCYLGKVPEKIIPELVARLEKHEAMQPVRKPVQAVPFPSKKGRVA